jgi:hypothetical protein
MIDKDEHQKNDGGSDESRGANVSAILSEEFAHSGGGVELTVRGKKRARKETVRSVPAASAPRKLPGGSADKSNVS